MQSIRELLRRNPGLLRCGSGRSDWKARRRRYARLITDDFDKLEDIASEYLGWVVKMPGWRLATAEAVFNFGRKMTQEYRLSLQEVDRLFNEVLARRLRGALLGFFISGAYNEIIRQEDLMLFDLGRYKGAVSGLGYRHPRGRLLVRGSRAYYLGVYMKGGEIVFRGDAGNHLGTSMHGGRLSIEGNVGNWIGQHMRGGLISVRGDAGHIIGKNMSGGEIQIEGNAGSWVADGMRGGIIRIKGNFELVDEERSGGAIFRWQVGRWQPLGSG